MKRSKTLLNLTGFRATRKPALAKHAYCFVALRWVPTPYEWHPRGTPRCSVPAPASISPRQNGNASFDFAAFDAAHRNAIYASGAYADVHYRYPFLFHGMSVVGRFPPIISL